MRSDCERLRRSSIRVTRANVSRAKPQVNTFERLSKRSRSKVDLKMRRPMRHTRGMTDTAALARLAELELETPSWGYGNSGTRFHVFPWPGAARTVWERIDDAALVHRLTGCCPSVALHIPWDRVDDWPALRGYASERGIRIGAINPNLFGDDAYRLGSLCHPDERVREQALEHCRECLEIARQVGSTVVSLWLADGTNYPGQDDLRERHARLTAGLEELYGLLPADMRLLVEYKFFEPGFYSTALPDWGTAAMLCRRLGPQAQVLVDTGHQPQGTNVEQIVAVLLAEGLLGGFHFNNRKYADDDLIVGSIDPFELFRIMREIAAGGAENVAFMIDQSHNIEGKIDAYVEAHRQVKPEMLAALRDAGIRNYTIFRHGNEMFGYFESDDLAAAAAYMESQEANARWQDAMAELLEERVPDAGPPTLEEIFRLD